MVEAEAAYATVIEAMRATTPTVASQMFGMPCLKTEGRAFAGLYGSALVVKLQGEHHAQALALAGAHVFDPSGRGRPMRAWVVVPLEHAARWLDLTRQAFGDLG